MSVEPMLTDRTYMRTCSVASEHRRSQSLIGKKCSTAQKRFNAFYKQTLAVSCANRHPASGKYNILAAPYKCPPTAK